MQSFWFTIELAMKWCVIIFFALAAYVVVAMIVQSFFKNLITFAVQTYFQEKENYRLSTDKKVAELVKDRFDYQA